VFSSLVELRNAARVNAVLPEALEAEREKMLAEFRRIQAIADLDERAGAVVRMEVVDEILTLRCPRPNCRAAFVDFDGCFALTCGRCRAGFCGWCLADCGADAHGHVARCREGTGKLYPDGGMLTFNNHHDHRRGQLVAERLAREPAAVRAIALRLLEPDLLLPEGGRIPVAL